VLITPLRPHHRDHACHPMPKFLRAYQSVSNHPRTTVVRIKGFSPDLLAL
jgi:hypothetical protein